MVTHTHQVHGHTQQQQYTDGGSLQEFAHRSPLYFPSIHTMLACRGLLDWQKEVTSGQSVVPAGLHGPGTELTSFSFLFLVPAPKPKMG